MVHCRIRSDDFPAAASEVYGLARTVMLNERLPHQMVSALEGLRALMATSPHLESVTLGAPELTSELPVGWASFGHIIEVGTADGAVRSLTIELNCWIAVHVNMAAGAAERTLIAVVSDMAMRLALNMVTSVDGVESNLDGSCTEMRFPWSPSAATEYAAAQGLEVRQHMLTVRVTLQA